MKSRWALVVVFFLALGLTYWVNTKVPRAFVPEEDQGYFLTIVQAPAGSSLQYTGAIAREAEKILMAEPDILGVFSVMGFSFSGAAPNQGIVFASLKPFDERKGAEHSAAAVVGRVLPKLLAIPGAIVVSIAPPSIPGLSRFGGFEFQVLDQTGTDISTLAGGRVRRHGRRRASRRCCRASSPRSPRTIRSCSSASIGSARWRPDCRSARSRARCRRSWGRRT